MILQVTGPNDLKNYFRYDATISRDYYRAIATLEKMQAARPNRTATVRERTNSPVPPETATSRQASANTPLHSSGFVSYYVDFDPQDSRDPQQPDADTARSQSSSTS